MFCGKCGAAVADGGKFCPNCGAATGDTGEFKPEPEMEGLNVGAIDRYAPGRSKSKDFSSEFVEPDEQLVAQLGNNYFVNFMFNKIQTCNALLTDKRLYLRGNAVDTNGGKIARSNVKKTIDLEDITGTGFVYSSGAVWKLVLGIIFIWTVITPIILFVSYFKGRNTMFFIEYAGGSIKFDASIHGVAESEDFEKQIRRAKNKVKGKK